jgi:hypothetical protein
VRRLGGAGGAWDTGLVGRSDTSRGDAWGDVHVRRR